MKHKQIIFALIVVAGIGWAVYAWWDRKFSYDLPAGPVVAYKLDGNHESENSNAKWLYLWPIVEERAMDESTAGKIREILADSRNYRVSGGSKCFDPGMAFRLGSKERAVDVVICLHCKHVYFYKVGDDGSPDGVKHISDTGLKAFGILYNSLFPKSSTTNPTTKVTTKGSI